MAPNTAAVQQFLLPTQIIGPADVGRVSREMDDLNNVLLTQVLQRAAEIQLPKLSLMLDQTVQLNKLQLANEADRQALLAFLKSLNSKAPVMHISFSTDPSAPFMEKLVAWLRREIQPLILVTVGLQPNIGAGCILRSTNHQFDFSLRQDMVKKRSLLLELLDAQMPEPVSNIAAITMPLGMAPVTAASATEPVTEVPIVPAPVSTSPMADTTHAAAVHQTIHQPVAQPVAPAGAPA